MAELNPAIPATLLRRLAEAADGERTSTDAWFVAPVGNPFGEIRGPYGTEDDAQDAAETGDGVFGPYNTPADFRAHTKTKRITRIEVRGEDEHGAQYRASYDPAETDALFFGRPALEKFVLPYLTRVYGLRYAQAWVHEYAGEPGTDPQSWEAWPHKIWSPLLRCELEEG